MFYSWSVLPVTVIREELTNRYYSRNKNRDVIKMLKYINFTTEKENRQNRILALSVY